MKMQKEGKVTRVSQYGFQIDGASQWYNYETNYVSEKCNVGDAIGFSFNQTSKDGKTYCKVTALKVNPVVPEKVGEGPQPDNGEVSMSGKQKVIECNDAISFEIQLNDFSRKNDVFSTQTHITAIPNKDGAVNMLYTAICYYR